MDKISITFILIKNLALLCCGQKRKNSLVYMDWLPC
jgi:hypothetical protein